MTYFTNTDNLLKYTSFLKFARKVYTVYIGSDDFLAQVHSEEKMSYDLTVDEWLLKLKEKPAFKAYAEKLSKNLVIKDWESVIGKLGQEEKEKVSKIETDFLQEADVVRASIARIDYLKPIEGSLNEVLDRITSEHKSSSISKVKSNSMAQEDAGTPKLIWNGGVSTLGTLFHDLRTLKPKNSKTAYLDYAYYKDLAIIVHTLFVQPNGEPFSLPSLETYIDPEHPKIAKKDRVDITNIDRK